MLQNRSENSSDVRRLGVGLCSLSLTLERAAERTISRRFLRGRLCVTTRERGKDDRTKNHEKPLGLVRPESRCLLHALLHRLLMLAEDSAE